MAMPSRQRGCAWRAGIGWSNMKSNRLSRMTLACVAAIAVGALAQSAGAQPTPAQQNAVRQHCRTDFRALCAQREARRQRGARLPGRTRRALVACLPGRRVRNDAGRTGRTRARRCQTDAGCRRGTAAAVYRYGKAGGDPVGGAASRAPSQAADRPFGRARRRRACGRSAAQACCGSTAGRSPAQACCGSTAVRGRDKARRTIAAARGQAQACRGSTAASAARAGGAHQRHDAGMPVRPGAALPWRAPRRQP